MEATAGIPGTKERWFWCTLVSCSLLYWLLYSSIAPVTTWDSHVYNLARIPLTAKEGLFGNTQWTTSRQIYMPGSFDFLHYPFLILNRGFAIPSWLCLLGLTGAVWQLVKRWSTERAAWMATAGILAMPCVVYQGSSTKNDLIWVFCLFAWALAITRYHDARKAGDTSPQSGLYLIIGAVALGLCAGAKTTGVPFALLATAATSILIRKNWKEQAKWLLAVAGSMVLLGSTETYINNWIEFKSLLGPKEMIDLARNPDGIKGAMANVLRYYIENLNFGLEEVTNSNAVLDTMAATGQRLLDGLRLGRTGVAPWDGSQSLHFLSKRLEHSAGYGPVGFLALFLVPFTLFRFQWRTFRFHCAAVAAFSLGMIAYFVGWMPFNNRFLLLPFCLGAIVVADIVASSRARWPRMIFAILVLAGAFVLPLFSLNRTPADLLMAKESPKKLMTLEHPAMLPLVRKLGTLKKSYSADNPLILVAGWNSWVLPVLQELEDSVISAESLDRTGIERLLSSGRTHVDILFLETLPVEPNEKLDAESLRDFENARLIRYSTPAMEPLP